MDLKLDNTGDLDITNNRLSMVDGLDYIAQAWRIRSLTLLGEWFLDERIGVPYLQHILVKRPNWNLVRAIFRKTALLTPGIKEVHSLDLEIDAATRELYIEITGKTEDLETFVFSFRDFIIKNREVSA